MRIFKQGYLLNRIFSEHTIIAWMMSVAIIPMLLLALFAYKRSEATLERTITNVLLTEIKQKVDEINNNISSKKNHLIQFSELPQFADAVNSLIYSGPLNNFASGPMTAFTDYLEYITPRIGVSNIYVISLENKVLYALHQNKIVGQILSNKDKTNLDLYHAVDGALMLRMPYLYTAFNGNVASDLRIYLSNIIRDHGIAKAVLVLQLAPYNIERESQVNFGYAKSEHTYLGLLSGIKPKIVLSAENEIFLAKNRLYKLELEKLLGYAIQGEMLIYPVELTRGSQSLLAIYSYVPQLNMGMIIEYDKAEVFQRIVWLKINMIIITLVDLLLVIMIVLWIAGSLREAHAKSERLLENILPKFVANELNEKKKFLARHVYNVSIIFIDIINFTPFSLSKLPETVVVILDELFSIFDTLSEQYQLEKIKTIGDAYMAVSGLILPQADHASRAINMGLDAIEAIQQYNLKHGTNFSIRVGIDSGNVIAGIIGKKKFSYDLWGNAVNGASRMESMGFPNEVQISDQTYNAIVDKNNYNFTPRQKVLIKGLGEMNTYFVSRKKQNEE